jgi:hypothetical protein
MSNILYSKEEIELLVGKFKGRTLSKVEWTHEAHLIVGLWFMNTYGLHEGICRLKSGIILLNQALQIENTGNMGYHETLTVFWAKVIATYINISSETTLEGLVNEFLSSRLADKLLPFEFYDKHILLSKDYRTIYISEENKTVDHQSIGAILLGG